MVSVYSATSGLSSASQINKNDRLQTKALHQVASGKSINKASDNAAGLAIATSLMSDVSALKQSSTNLVQGSAVLQTADGALEQAGNILNRMKELSTQANSGALDNNSRTAINDEYQNLKTELDNLSTQTTFNGQQLLNGTYNQNYQAGTNASDTVNADLSALDVSANGLGLSAANGNNANALTTQASAAATSSELDTAINNLSGYRAQVGAISSEFSTRGAVLEDSINSTIEAESAISDADIGKASSDLASSNALSQLSIAAAAQGNRMTSSLLGLVRQGGAR